MSIAREPMHGTSILNTLPATVTALAEDGHPALRLVRLSAGGVTLLARLTTRSAADLELAPGRRSGSRSRRWR